MYNLYRDPGEKYPIPHKYNVSIQTHIFYIYHGLIYGSITILVFESTIVST